MSEKNYITDFSRFTVLSIAGICKHLYAVRSSDGQESY